MRWFNLLLLCALVLCTSPVLARKKKKGNKGAIPRELIVFNKLQFGVSPAEYKALYPDSMQKIGEYTYIFRPVFTANKLVGLNIVTQSEEAKEFKNYGLLSTNALVSHFTSQYGPPFAQWYVPALTSFNTYQRADISTWQISTKRIDIYVLKCDHRSYCGVCSITGSGMVTARH